VRIRGLGVLAALVGLVFFAALAGAQLPKQFVEGGNLGAPSSGDSTSFTLANGESDTTLWVNMTDFTISGCAFAGQPQVKISVNTNAVTGDTLGLITQYSPDKSAIYAKTKVNLIGASPQAAAVVTCDTQANDAAYGWKFMRWILSDDDVTRTASYTNVKVGIEVVTAR